MKVLTNEDLFDTRLVACAMAVPLVIALHRGFFDIFKYLWSHEFVHVWDPMYFDFPLTTIKEEKPEAVEQLIEHFLTSAPAINAFMRKST